MGNCGSEATTDREYDSDSLSNDDDDTSSRTSIRNKKSIKETKKSTSTTTAVDLNMSRKMNHKYPWVNESHVVNDVYSVFIIEKELGRGASCRVLKVKHNQTGKKYAMKEMVRNDKWNPMLFEQECKILQTLEGHPNILQFCFIHYITNTYKYTHVCIIV